MKISELMEKLGELQGLHGDVEVKSIHLDKSGNDTCIEDPEPEFTKPWSFDNKLVLL